MREKKRLVKKKKPRVFAMMSGGVDSSVAALLLKRQGYDITGVFIRSYNLDGCAERDAEDARRVAEKLKIPFYVWDFEEEYKKKVVDYMIGGYRTGLTPNPDVMCNKEIKFGLFLEKALEAGADYVATGHYVIISPVFSLFEAKDKNKDQSYFLWTLTQEQLKHCLFPIGGCLKSEVREIAKKAGLPTAEKKDSQGICFLGKVTLIDFLKQHIPERMGDVLLIASENNSGDNFRDREKCHKVVDGKNEIQYKKIGEHKGAYFYTVGQRRLKIFGLKSQTFSQKPLYVAEKNVKTNTLVLAEGSDNPALYKKEIDLADVNLSPSVGYQAPDGEDLEVSVLARVRYRQPLAEAVFKIQDAKYTLNFNEPVKFVAYGQSAVFYSRGGELLGGGVIK